jgi:predicted amidohydrolase
MSTTTVGIAQWHAVCGEPLRNLDSALTHIESLAARGCELIVLPELWASGYDAVLKDDGVAVTLVDVGHSFAAYPAGAVYPLTVARVR